MYIIRTATEADLPKIILLLRVTNLLWEIGDSVEILSEKLKFDPSSILVLETQEEIVGTVMTTYDPWASFMWHLVIEPEYQGYGLGHILADEAERRLKARGTTSVNGYILPGNERSLSLAKKRGFKSLPSQVIAVEKIL